jgi:hypothetical protein
MLNEKAQKIRRSRLARNQRSIGNRQSAIGNRRNSAFSIHHSPLAWRYFLLLLLTT